MAMAACYLLLPYTRMALVDSGQLVPAALIVAAVFWHNRPALAGSADRAGRGLDSGLSGSDRALVRILPRTGGVAIHGRRRGRSWRPARCWGYWVPESRATGLGRWALAASTRSGCFRSSSRRSTGSFWVSIDASFRLPVLIAYLALVILTMFWPADKNLAELIALSAALLVASQFWYLDKGGTLVMLYLPLAIAMMFRPTIAIRRAAAPAHQRRANRPSLSPSS